MAVKVRSYYPVTIPIDDPETGDKQNVKMRVRRLNIEEFAAFSAKFRQSSNHPSRALVARLPDGDEQEKDDTGAFKVSDERVLERRLVEMSDEERARYDAMDAAEETFAREFLRESISIYITVESGELFEEKDGKDEPIINGVDLVRLYGARRDVLSALLNAIWSENTLSAHEKKALRSLSDLKRSLTERALVAVGTKPETIAPSVDAPVFVETGAATESTAALSGSGQPA